MRNSFKVFSSEHFARGIRSRILEPLSGHTDLSKEEKISLIQNVLDELAKEDNK